MMDNASEWTGCEGSSSTHEHPVLIDLVGLAFI